MIDTTTSNEAAIKLLDGAIKVKRDAMAWNLEHGNRAQQVVNDYLAKARAYEAEAIALEKAREFL